MIIKYIRQTLIIILPKKRDEFQKKSILKSAPITSTLF